MTNEQANTPTVKPTKRSAWIAQRADELIAKGWQSRRLAEKRAAKEWRRQSPQHVAAVKRNDAMRAARSERLATL